MRALVSVAAAGNSPWVPLDYVKIPFAVGLFGDVSSPSTLTYKVQHSPDDCQTMRQITSLTRSGTTATVVDPAHKLTTGDSLQVMNSGDANLDTLPGIGADITVVDANTYTYVVANTGATAAKQIVRVITQRVFDHPLMTGLTGRQDGNYDKPVTACRLRITAYTSGSASLQVTQGYR